MLDARIMYLRNISTLAHNAETNREFSYSSVSFNIQFYATIGKFHFFKDRSMQRLVDLLSF